MKKFTELGVELPKGYTTKTNGKGEEIIIPDPDYLNEERLPVKRRSKYPSNLTPKKKKRKR